MPGMGCFQSPEACYVAFFHETMHWTGPIRFGSERYRTGAAFLAAMTGIDLRVLDNAALNSAAAYIAGWLRHIRSGWFGG
ncbi:hypothetical protein ASZ90_011263 [hydrocarbon metagenome]|uniref:Polyvalent protein metallopeptidase domain-containing protein n=1 Tax=hydrocarbon metagenome TaxID=938273 RepID=A0A0W8FDQ6_9ZZZZ